MNNFNNQFTKSQRKTAFSRYHQGEITESMKEMMAWESPKPSLKCNKCSTCKILNAQGLVKKDYCCGLRKCRIKSSKQYHDKSQDKKDKVSKRLKRRYRERPKAEKVGISINKAKGQKRRYSTMSESERSYLRQRQQEGMALAAKDAVKKQKRINNRYDRLKSGMKIHQHYVLTPCGKKVKVWTRGWEHRTIKFLVDVFGGERELYTNYRLTNDVYIVGNDNPHVFKPYHTFGIDPNTLKTPSIYFKEGNMQLGHDLDHFLQLPNNAACQTFAEQLAKQFEIENKDLHDLIQGKSSVAIETKSFKMAVVKKGDDWLDKMLANAIAALAAKPKLIYLIFCWTISSLTLYNVDKETASLNQLGKTILFPDTAKNYKQLIKYHMDAFKLIKTTEIACPGNFTTTELKSAKPIKDGYVDSVWHRLNITIRK